MAHLGADRDVFVAALATGKSVTNAAQAASVSRRTATRWFNEPEVQAGLTRLRRATLDHARLRLLGLVDAAADTLGAVMADGESPAARVSAARTVLAQVLRFDERTEMEERLQRIEQHIEAQKQWPAQQRWSR